MTTSGSNDTRQVTIKPTVDASGVKPGVDQTKRELGGMLDDVRNKSRQASKELSAMLEGAKKDGPESARALAGVHREMQKMEAELLSGSQRNSAAWQIEYARLRGVSEQALGPMVERHQALLAVQRQAIAGQQQMTVSAAQTANALRQVPMQFTDIFTSLAAGQPPLMVLLQQGGQLKDSFGGAGAAAQALGGYVAGLISPTTLLAAAVSATVIGYAMGSQEQQRFAAGLILSGNAAGTSAGQLATMAASLDALSNGGTQSKAAEVLNIIAGAGEVAAGSLQRFTQVAIAMERAGGPAAAETAKAFAELGKSPLQASMRLTESMRYLDAATAEQIATLERQGRTTEAAQLAQDAYANALEQRAPEMEARLGTLERLWRGIKDATKEAGDELLQLGRSASVRDQVQAIEQQLGRAQRLQGNGGGGFLGQLLGGNQAELQAQREALLEQARLLQRSAEAQGVRTRQEEAGLVWMREGQRFLSDRVKLEEEVLRIRNQGLAAGKSEEQIAERLRALVAQRFSAKAGAADPADRDRERALRAEARLLAELSGVTTDYAADLQTLNDAYARGRLDYDAFVDATAKLSARQPGMVARARELAKATEEEADARRRQQQEQARFLAGLDANLDAGARNLDQMRLEIVELTLGKQARMELELQERERLAVTYEQTAATLEANGADSARHRALAAQVRDEIRLRRQLLEAYSAKEAADDWKRASADIERALTDALMRGFENGRGFMDSLVSSIKSTFNTMVLRPVVQAIVKPAAAMATNLLFGGPASASAGGGSGAGMLGQLSQLGPLASLAQMSSVFNAGTAAAMSGNISGALAASGNLISGGSVGTGLSFGAGALAGPALAYAVSTMIARKIGGGYSIMGGSGNTLNNLLGPVGGVINRAFGRKRTEFTGSGVTGQVGADGFEGQAYTDWIRKGGWFRSDKTGRDLAALGADMQSAISSQVSAVYAATTAYAEALGLPADSARRARLDFSVAWGGSEEANQRALQEASDRLANDLAGLYAPALAEYSKAGEQLAETLARLGTLQVFSDGLNELGGVFARVARLSVQAREELIGMAGGMEQLAGLAQGFVQNYYSRDEIAGLKARDLQAALSSVGITQDLRSRDDFRSLVESTDVSTEAGRQRLTQLLRVSGDFAQLSDYLGETGIGLQAAALQAPETSQLADLFSSGTQEQVTATNEVRDSVDRVGAGIERLLQLMGRAVGGTSGGRLPLRDLVPEVLLD
jgi:phage-related minor tail protein